MKTCKSGVIAMKRFLVFALIFLPVICFPNPDSDSIVVELYDDACQAARIGKGLAADNPTDLSGNCITDLKDLALMLTTWLVDHALTAPVPK